MKLQTADLRSRSRAELDEIFRRAEPGPIPAGPARGTALIVPGTALDRFLAAIVRLFWWKGKIFRPESRDLKNRITPFGIPAIRAEVYVDDSWFADGQAIILDYSKSSFVARKIRDEIREVGPGVYLGQVFWGRKRLILFSLEFPRGAAA
ncbi:MAG: hypothetical protein GWO00_02810 [Gemmatimonadetes bacterium]|nr:hypothetical protein [Gemmatimonadota bacterium]NIR77347.1 hypothetical protein [Gemmatimonadota bacterium]NIT85873.1 hypothetical protein [Gemmatimonadota bacterium]NIU29695.1 hypothetical protein [Gemmatimonadota bacterium]NIV60104.1 hypothetical protein [Gemmatimonadota bacterium]